METTIKILFILIIGIVFGYCWAFYSYQPLKLSQENKELKTDLKLLNMAYVRDISEGFIDEDAYKIVR